MADCGYRVTRDSCGKYSQKEIIDKFWDYEEARALMFELVDEELDKLNNEKGTKAYAVNDDDICVVEIRAEGDGMLISYYEVEEFDMQ